jgi:hypothetical protein
VCLSPPVLQVLVLLLALSPICLAAGCKSLSRSRDGEPTPIILTVLEEDQKTELRRSYRREPDVIRTAWSEEAETEILRSSLAPPTVLVELDEQSPRALRPRPRVVAVNPSAAQPTSPPTQNVARTTNAEDVDSDRNGIAPRTASQVDWESPSSRRTKTLTASDRPASRHVQPSPSRQPREFVEHSAEELKISTITSQEAAPSADEVIFRSISQINTDITAPPPEGDADDEREALDVAASFFSRYKEHNYQSEVPRTWGAYGALQITQAFCHRPLYFEEINVERYGYSAGVLQPAVSAARFFATVPTLPYRMAIDGPGICQVDPSPYPPGHPAPRHRQRPPLHVRAAIIQAVAVVGMVALFP